MQISNNFTNNFKGFKEFVCDAEDLTDREKCFVDYLKDHTEEQINKINGKKDFEFTDKYIPAVELKNYDIIDVYGDIYRDKANKNEIFLKLRIKPTPDSIEIIKAGADENAKAELNRNPLITETISPPIAVRSKNAYNTIIKFTEEKLEFFKRYISGAAKWKTTTKDLLKTSNKPKFGWDKDLLTSIIYVGKH